jgi:hypothetical protein
MRRYVLSTRAHNTIRVDGQDQNRRLSYNRADFDVTAPSDGRLRSAPGYDVAEGVYDEGYGPDAAPTVRHERKVIFRKPQQVEDSGMPNLFGPCLIVIDRLIPADAAAHTYQVMWHLNADAVETDGLTVRSADGGQPNLTILPAQTAGLTVRVVSGQETPEFQGWKAIKNHQQGEYVVTPTAIYEWTVTGPARLVTLLYATRAGAACPVAAVSASSDVAAKEIRLSLRGGAVVVLDEGEL